MYRYVAVFLIVIASTVAEDFYVSKSGSNSDGRSWAAAWNDVNNINWGNILPGDTIYLDGGTSSMSYGKFVTGAGGTSSNRILITRSKEAGHDGKVYFSGAEVNHPYITIDGLDKDKLEVYGSGGYTIRIQGSADNTVLDNIYLWGEMAPTWGVLIYLTSGSLTINHSEISGQSASEDQIKFYSQKDMRIENSVFHGWKSIDGSHSDFLEGACNSGSQPSCPGGSIIVRNSYFYDSPHDCFMMSDTAFDYVEFTGNVFDGVSDAIKIYSADKVVIHNNIFRNCRQLVTYSSSTTDCKNNIFLGISPWGNPVNTCSGTYSMWATGSPGFVEAEGNIQADPMFLNTEDILGPDGIAFTSDDGFNLKEGSPARGAGENGFDIGPFQYSSQPSSTCENCHYIRDGSSGDGSSWANAWDSLPDTLQRGHTYYIADGSYESYTFDDAESSSQWITLKKATTDDHGTDAGWQNSYGDGQAVFNSAMVFEQGHYLFDGQVRDEDYWFDGDVYGFRINHNNQDQNIVISNYGVNIRDITIQYVYIDAIYQNLPSTTVRRLAVDTDGFDGGTTATGLVFSHMYVHGSCNVWHLRTTDGAIVEYSASDGAASNSANHGEIVNLYYSGNNAIIRYNRFKNAFVGEGGGGTAIVAITYADGLQFYGNTVWNFAVGDASIGYAGYYSSHNRVYGNTFVDSVGYNSGTAFGSGTDNVVYNNLWVNCPTINIDGTHDYNGFSDSNARGESNAQTNVPMSIFSSYAGKDFMLTSPTKPGIALTPPYDQDMLGNVRGADGVWDRGAIEYTGTCTPMTISELSAVINQWKDGSRTIEQVMQAIKMWKDGC